MQISWSTLWFLQSATFARIYLILGSTGRSQTISAGVAAHFGAIVV